jgi:prevent-host-death family protein
MKYSIYEAKARLSEVIRMVKARRRVTITERGMPVAEIIPYTPDRPESLSERITKLAGTGAILPSDEPFLPKPLTVRSGAVERFLQQDRE